MSATREDLIEMMNEAERRGEMDDAKQFLIKIESMSQPRQNPHPPTFSERVKSREINTRQQREPKQTREFTADAPGAAIFEPALSLGGSLLGSSIGGWGGIGSMLLGDSADQSARDIQATKDFFAYQPSTERGKAGLENVGEAGEYVGNRAKLPLSIAAGGTKLLASQYDDQSIEEGLPGALKTGLDVQTQGPQKTLSESIFESTESPLLASLGLVLPDALMAFIPMGIAKHTKTTAFKKDIFKRLSGRKKETFGTELETVPHIVDDVDLVKYMTKGVKGIEHDSLAKAALKQGIDPEIVVIARGATEATKAKLLKQMNIAKRRVAQPLWGVKNRPADVAGESLNGRVQHLQMVRKNAGSQLDNVAKNLKGKTVDFSQPVNKFLGKLEDMGIKFDGSKIPETGKDWRKVFQGSDIEFLSAPESAIRNIIKRMASGERGKMPSAYELHQLKKYIDNNVVYGKTPGGLIGKVKNELKTFRHDINKLLQDNFPEYGRVNRTYAETTGALDELSKSVKLDLSDIPEAEKYLDAALGQELRKFITNYKARVPMVKAVEKIDVVLKKYGGKFEDDITTQMLYSDMLDDIFEPAAKGSFKGSIQSAIGNSMNKNAIGIAQNMSEEAIKHMNIKNAQKAAKIMEDLLKRPVPPPMQEQAYRAARWPQQGKEIIPR